MSRDSANSNKSIHPKWSELTSYLGESAKWSSKGLTATCPFCFKEADGKSSKFLISFSDAKFKYYNCFSCENSGTGHGGVARLLAQVGMKASFAETAEMSGQDGSFSQSEFKRVSDNQKVEEISWPPDFASASQETINEGIEYIRSRGVSDPIAMIRKYDLVITERIENPIIYDNGDEDLKEIEYKCILIPMAGANDEIIGWTTRRIGDNPDDPMPKSIALSGRGWKKKALYGIREIDPTRPVTVVEGWADAMATPNSVAAGGKDVSAEQIKLIAGTKARVIIFALDPTVNDKLVAQCKARLALWAPSAKIYSINWPRFGGYIEKDPAERGFDAMTEIIYKTVKGIA